MNVSLWVESRKLEGYRPPPVPFTADGLPIIPAKGDVVVMNNVALDVVEVVWFYHHDLEKRSVTVHLKEQAE